MSNSQQWHYTDQSGQQAGPIPTDELLQLIASKSVPLTAMAWKEGMANWKPVSQIEELQAGTSTPPPSPDPVPNPAPTQAPGNIQEPNQNPINPYETPQVPTDEEFYAAAREQPNGYGGIGRLAYFLLSIGHSIAIQFIAFVLNFSSFTESNEPSLLIAFGLLTVSTVISFYLLFSRFKNIGMSRWWTLGLVVPILNIFVSIWLISRQEGWVETRKLDGPGKIVAWIFGILITLIVTLTLISVLFFASSAYKKASDEAEQRLKTQQEQSQSPAY